MYRKNDTPEKFDFETLHSWESATITHATKTRWDKSGEYFRQGMVMEIEPSMPKEIVSETTMLAGLIKSMRKRCYCEHDCCGHIFSGVHSARKLKGSDNRWLVVISGGRNI